jgi:hypothetical protein
MSEVENTAVEETVVSAPEPVAEENKPEPVLEDGIPSEEAAEAEASNVPPAEYADPINA